MECGRGLWNQVLFVLVLLILVTAIKISDHDNDDDTYTTFMIKETETVSKEVSLNVGNTRYTCRLNKKASQQQAIESKKAYDPPQTIINRYTGETFSYAATDHSFHVKIGHAITQSIGSSTEMLKTYESSQKDMQGRLYQVYSNGDQCAVNGKNIAREANLYFQCSINLPPRTAKIISVREPTICKYTIIAGLADACPDHPEFPPLISIAEEGPGRGVKGYENWFLSISKSKADKEGGGNKTRIVCKAQNIGFGQMEMSEAKAMRDFDFGIVKTGVRTQTEKEQCRIVDWEAKYGDRRSLRHSKEQSGSMVSKDGFHLEHHGTALNYIEIHTQL